jgi:hypothetical protein
LQAAVSVHARHEAVEDLPIATVTVRAEPCELIVHDAYHRVLSRELVNGDLGATAASSERGTFSDRPDAA